MILIIILENILLALNRGSFLDPDLGWRLRLGQYMVETGHLPTNFIGYNYFHDLQFVDHQWLSNLLIYLAYDKWGYYSLFAVSIILFSLASVLLYRLSLRKSSILLALISVVFFLITISQGYVGFRLQYILYPAAILILFVSESVKKYWLRLIIYCLIFMLGSNLHGGGFLFLIFVPVLLEAKGLFDDWQLKNKAQIILKMLLMTILLLLAMSINPYGADFWALMWEYIREPSYKKYIGEWHQLLSLPLNWLNLVIYSLVVFVFTVEKNWRKIEKHKLVLYIILAVFAYFSKRSLPLFVLLALPELCGLLKNFFPKTKNIFSASLILFLFVSAIISLSVVHKSPVVVLPSRNVFNTVSEYPAEALAYYSSISSSSDVLFNHYDWGGFISWKYPSFKVFIDGRAPQKNIGKKAMLQEYIDIIQHFDEKMIGKYNFSFLLVKKENPYICTVFDKKILLAKCESNNNLITQYLDGIDKLEQKDYLIRVFDDEKSILYKVNK